jgi:Phosphoesterase family.
VVLLAAVVLLAVAVVVARVVRPPSLHSSPVMIGSAGPAGRIPTFQHVYVLVLENKSLASIIGNPQAPYLNGLATRYALATNYAAVAHPSQPNYLGLFGGSTHGITDDRSHNVDGPSIATELDAAGRSWRVVEQNVPAGCFTRGSASDGEDGPGNYARKHNPAISFTPIRESAARCANIVDFSHFRPGVADYQFIAPNLCNDMHDCSIAHGDAFIRDFLGSLVNGPTWSRDDVVFVTFDEASHGDKQNLVPLIVVSDKVRSGFRSTTPHTHYSLLRTIEESWGLPCLGQTCSANDLSEIFSPNG